MKSLGESWKQSREGRGISIEQVVSETNISRAYIEALEAENFDVFPAEAYLLGFMRNYSDFLGMNTDKVIARYRNLRLSEQPIPMEQLIGPAKGARIRRFIPWLSLGLGVIVGLFFLVPVLFNAISSYRDKRESQKALEAEINAGTEIRVQENFWEGEVSNNDTLILEPGDVVYTISISLEDNGRLGLQDSRGEFFSIRLGEEVYIPDDNGQPVWRLYLKDTGLAGNKSLIEAEKLEVVSVERIIPLEQEEVVASINTRNRQTQVVLNSSQPRPFDINMEIRDFVMLRYMRDRQEPVQKYLSRGETVRIDVRRNATLWISDAGAVSLKILGNEISPGSAGQVSVYQFRWVRDEVRGGYNLSAIPVP